MTTLRNTVRSLLALVALVLLGATPPDLDRLPTSLWVEGAPPLSVLPQPVSIEMPDGHVLAGVYYPARVNPAPVVVLMHWAAGNKSDWVSIAPWLQNRSDELSGPERVVLTQLPGKTWRASEWFPAIRSQVSFGVLIFDFECIGQSSCKVRNGIWLEDALAAVDFASRLEGVNAEAIVTVGASIGADGAVDGCYLFNQSVSAGRSQGQCLGALSLSPGNFLTNKFTYAEAAHSLLNSGRTVYCIGSRGDGTPNRMCSKLQADSFRTYLYSGKPHGMELLTPNLFPEELDRNAMQLILDFLRDAIGEPVAANLE